MTDDHGDELERPSQAPGQGDYGDDLRPALEDRVEELERRVGNVELDEDTRTALAAVPNKIIGMEGRLERVDERSSSLSEAHGQVRRELADFRAGVDNGLRDLRRDVADDVRRLEELITNRFNVVDAAHHKAAVERWDNKPYVERLKDVMVIATPILLGLLTLAGVIYAARVGAAPK